MDILRSRISLIVTALLLATGLLMLGCAQTAPTAAPTAAPKAAAPAGGAPAAAPTTAAAPAAQPGTAVQEVKIGVIYPLSGGAATAGLDNKSGAELAVDVVNGKFDLNMPLAKTEGLPNLGGAKIKIISSDSQGLPEKGQSEAERLITNEKVTALYGAYHSSVTQTASQAAERLSMPFLNAESSSPALTERGLKWFFRTSPHDVTMGKALFDLLDGLKAKGVQVKTIASVYENTLYGSDANKITKQFAQERGYQMVAEVAYPANTNEVTSEVQRLKAANPDVVFQVSYTSDAILFMKTYKQLDFNPKGILTYGSGFVDPKFFEVLGKDAEYVVTRAPWAPDIAEKNPMAKAMMEMFQKKYNQPMTENSARAFTGMLTLADAIDRAKSTDPKAIQAALQATDIPASQLIMPWKGVKFGADGQNQLAEGIATQAFGGKHYAVYPFGIGAKEVMWPRPKWSEIK